MPTLTVYRHGATCGVGNSRAVPPARGVVQGWTESAVRRNTLFLFSVDESSLEGLHGLAITLTVGVCPPNPEDWGKARKAFFEALRRSGVFLVHWVTEWQRRGVPHLHLAAYWPDYQAPPPGISIIQTWLRIVGRWGAGARGQNVHSIYDALGWNKYTSKHAARGIHHYQRSPENIPAEWRGKSTGRMWGKLGDWRIQEPCALDLSWPAFWAYRRRVRRYRIASARTALHAAQERSESPQGLRKLRRYLVLHRRMLRTPDARLGAVRGIRGWVPEAVTLGMLASLPADGVLSV